MSNTGGRTPVVLVVLDGWGYRPERDGNAIELASTPVWHQLWEQSPRTLLAASGLDVGLPEGQMGNSEVGHLNLGAGRVVPQDLVRISQSVAAGEFYTRPPFIALGEYLQRTGGTLHLVGLLGPGGVHAIDTHLLACVELGVRLRAPRIAVQGFLDGRDASPTLGAEVVRQLLEDLHRVAGDRAVLASLTGRYYGMDRDHRWERTRIAYDALVHGRGPPVSLPVAAVREAYDRGETDEFMHPLIVQRHGEPVAPMRDGDAMLCFNYRSDRMRQIVRALTEEGFDGFDVTDRPALACATMTSYDRTFGLPVAFEPFSMARIMTEELERHGRSQFKTAETEKYPHVTYFFGGDHEPPRRNEQRVLVPSPRVATYDLQPEMSAAGVADALCAAIAAREHDFLLANFANADMVGHTGVLPAVIRAVEVVDECLGRITAAALGTGTPLFVTADHGNAEMMVDPRTGGVHTAHTTNPVPLVAVGAPVRALRAGGALCDVAPTLMRVMGMDQPPEMTGRDLCEA